MEPSTIVSGTNAVWSRDDDYAHGLWQYEYVFTGPQQITLPVLADAGCVDAAVTATDSANWAAGKYQWTLRRTKDTEVFFIASGFTTVLASPMLQTGVIDHHTHEEKMLALIEERLEGRIVSDHESYTQDGRSLNRIPINELKLLRTDYRTAVAKQKRRDSGKKPARHVRFRMR